MEDFTLLWNEYYPIVVAGIGALLVFLGTLYAIYTQVSKIIKPILDKIQVYRDKDDAIALDKSILDTIQLDILKADLLLKIENTSVSPALTLIYETQLAKLNELKIATNYDELVAKIEETKDTYLS